MFIHPFNLLSGCAVNMCLNSTIEIQVQNCTMFIQLYPVFPTRGILKWFSQGSSNTNTIALSRLMFGTKEKN